MSSSGDGVVVPFRGRHHKREIAIASGPPVHRNATCGLWDTVVNCGKIRPDLWRKAKATREVIGTCRHCGGYLAPDDPKDFGTETMRWFVARCLDCGHEVASPAGRLAKRPVRGS